MLDRNARASPTLREMAPVRSAQLFDVLRVGNARGFGTCVSFSYATGSFSPMVLSGLLYVANALATVSHMLYRHANHLPLSGLIWPETGYASIGCAAMASARLSSPGLKTIPRETRKSCRCHPPLTLRPVRVRRRSPPAH